MLGSVASGIIFGLIGAVMAWLGGHHLVMIGLAYALTGMIGVLGCASTVVVIRNQARDGGD